MDVTVLQTYVHYLLIIISLFGSKYQSATTRLEGDMGSGSARPHDTLLSDNLILYITSCRHLFRTMYISS